MAQAGKAFRSPLVGSVLLVFVILIAGCQSPVVSESFEQIELGKPLPAELPTGMERTPLGAGYIGSIDPDSQSDTNANMRIMSVLTDQTGKVIAKSYLAMNLSHCVLFLAGSYTYVIELDVPADAFGNTTRDWKAPSELTVLADICQIFAALPGEVMEKPDDQATTKPASAGTLAEVEGALNACLVEMRSALQELKDVSGSLYWGLLFSEKGHKALGNYFITAWNVGASMTMSPNEKGGRTVEYPIKNIPEAVLYRKILLDTATRPRKPADDGEVMYILNINLAYSKWVSQRVIALLSDRGAFSEATREGYDRSIPTLDGMRLRVRNLGGRRVRVEVGGTVIRDPIIAPLMLCLPR